MNQAIFRVEIDYYFLHFSLIGFTQTVYSEEMGSLAGDKQLFIPLGFYKGCKVAIKQINEKNIHLNRALMLELKKVTNSTVTSHESRV